MCSTKTLFGKHGRKKKKGEMQTEEKKKAK